jgi:site-specific DNA-methyltransferase (adenine-specific)
VSARPILYGDLSSWALVAGDSLTLMAALPAGSVDVVITDPPYGLGFKSESWDGGTLARPAGFQEFSRAWAAQARRVLRPGGHMVCFGATRTFHRLTAGVEDAGLEIRDTLLWLHGAGVPKSRLLPGEVGTALKPAYEPIILARAPLEQGLTVLGNVERHGTGALNIDATRPPRPSRATSAAEGPGYWPSHLLLSHQPDCEAGGGACASDCPVALIDGLAPPGPRGRLSRLFYCAKASRAEREAGCDQLEASTSSIFSGGAGLAHPRANVHPTVKPLGVMRWLVRLTAPPGGVVLDPFAGSGSTGCAAVLEGRQFVGVEREPRYLPIARARLAHWTASAAAATRIADSQDSASVPDVHSEMDNERFTL